MRMKSSKVSLADRARAARDPLAYERTVLANERTLLAYVRTALAFFGAGLGFTEFARSPAVIMIGWLLVPLGFVVLLLGIGSYRNSQKRTDENAAK
jgi:putative membrane protein